jgi:uncharacterized membrane protein
MIFKKGGEKMVEETQNQTNPNKDIQENKIIAAIGYISILCLIPLLAKKESKFAQFHGKQGLVLFIAEVATFIIGMVPILGWIIGFVLNICWIILSLIGLLKAIQGEYWKMPLLGQYAEKINL